MDQPWIKAWFVSPFLFVSCTYFVICLSKGCISIDKYTNTHMVVWIKMVPIGFCVWRLSPVGRMVCTWPLPTLCPKKVLWGQQKGVGLLLRFSWKKSSGQKELRERDGKAGQSILCHGALKQAAKTLVRRKREAIDSNMMLDQGFKSAVNSPLFH